MEQAWLDSLSEDWVSQPRSSNSPAPSLPSLSNSTSDFSSKPPPASSRIPKYNPQKQTWAPAHDGENSPLSEVSTNEHNMPLSQRRSSKLREITNGPRGRRVSRALSASTTHSVQYHTIEHKSLSLSPKRGFVETPEWKRRLLQGDVAYGEQRDLFSPAGLENIFRPPPAQTASPQKLTSAQEFGESSVMPSSPPPYNRNHGSEETGPCEEEDNEGDQSRQQPRAMKYKLVDQGESDFSVDDLSSSSFRNVPAPVPRFEQVVIRSDSASEPESSMLRGIDPGRTVSGQSDMRNEKLSPIYVARHNTTDGKIDYAALNLPPAELKRRLDQIRESTPAQSSQNEKDSSELLPVDMTTETDDFAHNGRFVNLRRGGQSQEGSFQKRMLSPSSLPAIDESTMLPEESMQASTPKELPNIRKTRTSIGHQAPVATQTPVPEIHTPHQSPKKATDQASKGNAGSPLKIFGTYDTFTNQKLLRRLSQFEEDLDPESDNEASGIREPTRPDFDGVFQTVSRPEITSKESHLQRGKGRKMSSFGAGELDSFQFSEGSYNSMGSNAEDEDKENIALPVLNPNTQNSFKFQLEPSPDLSDGVVVHRRAKYTTTTSTLRHTTSTRKSVRPGTSSSSISGVLSPQLEDLKTPRKRNGDSEGKRLPKSPLKDPLPKRRRTLRESENGVATGMDTMGELEALKDTHTQMQSVVGRKRKDARHGDDQQAANPTVLAMRQILRPRTPTPSQRSSQQHEVAPFLEEPLTSSERAKRTQEQKIAKIQAELDFTGPFKLPAALGGGQHMMDDSRKGSVTTQDFLDEAKKIMAGIRGKTRPRSGLTSLEESESENDRVISVEDGMNDVDVGVEDSYQESTQEPFSRPPSRDGKPLLRLPLKQEDPALLDHLRKYQEKSDMDGVIASSMRSIAMAKEAVDAANEADRRTEETIARTLGRSLDLEGSIESEPPNIRISQNPDAQRKRKHSTSTVRTGEDGQHEDDFPSQGSNGSSGQSTARSIPTGSSRGSDSRRVIAPHTVSHLIPEQLAGMVFVHESKKWVKTKTTTGPVNGTRNFLPSDETDEDPFGDIPDLSVDETQELQRIKAVAAKRKEDERMSQQHQISENSSSTTLPVSRMQTIGSESYRSHHPSEEPSAPAQQHRSSDSETRPKSSKEEPTPNRPSEKVLYVEKQTTITEEVEREISIHEDRVDPQSPRRQRNVTIAFSSPLASIIQGPGYDADSSIEVDVEGPSQLDTDADEDAANDSLIISKKESKSSQRSKSSKTRSSFRSKSRRMSLGGHTFTARPVSRIDEQDEDSINDKLKDQQRSVSIILSTPIPSRHTSGLVLATPRPGHEIGTLTLTPLSDFTVHHADVSLGLDVSYIAQGHRYVVGNTSKKTLSLSIKELVEKLTEVEPYEPFWEHIKELSLRDKRLTNLHKLNEFCEELVQLDVSHNQIRQLDGVPASTRNLRISHNCLTDLAAWNHLHNLQYIDVSNNELESFSAFKSLVHLRGIRADNNKIKTLDGVNQLDGLLSLRLRGNDVTSVNFTGTGLQRLSELDLKGNKINVVRNIQELRSLSALDLEGNLLTEFSTNEGKTMSALRYLKLSDNNLETIDVSMFPNLRLLYLDRNRLSTVSGLLKTKYLDSLSMREQQAGITIDQSFLSEACEVRKLFLSGNLLKTFEPQVDFLNLQYLELANCGIDTLPEEFGHMIPNTRILNLNFNALKDIRPLFGVVRLKKLHLAGNRLARLRSTTCVLAQFPTLAIADLRNNPLTLGFYPTVTESRIVSRRDGELEEEEEEAQVQDPFILPTADRGKDDKYVACLDMETRMLRRVYEVMILSNCRRIKTLDGLDVHRCLLKSKDVVWVALVKAGVFEPVSQEGGTDDGQGDENTEPEPEAQKVVEEERWPGEDSFA